MPSAEKIPVVRSRNETPALTGGRWARRDRHDSAERLHERLVPAPSFAVRSGRTRRWTVNEAGVIADRTS